MLELVFIIGMPVWAMIFVACIWPS